MTSKILVPPLKIQGIKTKLVPFIRTNISLNNNTIYYEPFMGSGVVGFNLAPKIAYFSDINPYIIDFYQQLQKQTITPIIVREYLTSEGSKLSKTLADNSSYYYDVRKRFNQDHNPLDFLFLQRANYNGLMRFSKNGYNVPFGKKPNRFTPALITKIVNQVANTQQLILQNNWHFSCQTWQSALAKVANHSFIYLDPPYINRNADYYTKWQAQDAENLVDFFKNRPKLHYALSMWYQNKYRKNEYIYQWKGKIITNEHFYFIGAQEKNRHSMIEALVIN